MAPEPDLGPREKFSALQDPDDMTVHPALDSLTQTTSKADRSATSCLRESSTRFQNRDDDRLLPGIRHQALRLYPVV